MKNNDLARKIDSMRQFGYVLLTPKEAKIVAIELRRVERLKKQAMIAEDQGWLRGWDDCITQAKK